MGRAARKQSKGTSDCSVSFIKREIFLTKLSPTKSPNLFFCLTSLEKVTMAEFNIVYRMRAERIILSTLDSHFVSSRVAVGYLSLLVVY